LAGALMINGKQEPALSLSYLCLDINPDMVKFIKVTSMRCSESKKNSHTEPLTIITLPCFFVVAYFVRVIPT
jgi:hypothetical protein